MNAPAWDAVRGRGLKRGVINAQPKSDRRNWDKRERSLKLVALKDLVGSWRMVKYEELPVDGSPTALPLGDRPKGYIIYQCRRLYGGNFSRQRTKGRKRIRSPMPAHIALMRNSRSFINKQTSP
jgi:hypothetical protein